uniref:Uncharacterized protein n=1 Tax=Triticum urartu TaxID=4572 RepID=A0A8R7R090_TRIUA
DGGPVEADGADAEAVEARAELLGEHGVGEHPADPGEGGEHLEQVAGEDVVDEAADEGHQEELAACESAFVLHLLLVECPARNFQSFREWFEFESAGCHLSLRETNGMEFLSSFVQSY